MIRVLFVCHGNICRSPMAEFVLKDITQKENLSNKDYAKYDYLIGMDEWNIRNMNRITGHDPDHKICRLLDFSAHPRDIADPWYTGNFEVTYSDVVEGCQAFLETLRRQKKI